MKTRRKWVLMIGILIGISLLIWQRETLKSLTDISIAHIISNF